MEEVFDPKITKVPCWATILGLLYAPNMATGASDKLDISPTVLYPDNRLFAGSKGPPS
jgi:hypothetical protein